MPESATLKRSASSVRLRVGRSARTMRWPWELSPGAAAEWPETAGRTQTASAWAGREPDGPERAGSYPDDGP